MADKPQYAKPASQVDLERRLENGNKSDRVLSTSENYDAPEPGSSERTYAVEGNDLTGYVGTASEYATYANETEKPGWAEDSVETKVAEEFVEAAGPVALTHESSQDEAKAQSEGEGTDEEGATEGDRERQKAAATAAAGTAEGKAEQQAASKKSTTKSSSQS